MDLRRKNLIRALSFHLLLVLVCFPAPSSAATKDSQNQMTIKTEGQSTVCAKPDRFRIVLSVLTQGKSLSDCCEKNEHSIAELEKVLEKYKLSSDAVQRSDLLFDKTYSYGFSILFMSGSSGSGSGSGSKDGKFSGYKLQRKVSVLLDNEKEVKGLIEDCARISDLSVNAIAFETSELDKLKMAARLAAVDKCKEQASAIAQQLRMNLAKPVNVEEKSVRVRYVTELPTTDDRYHRQAFDMSFNSNEYEIGKIAVSAEMIGIFEIVESH